MQTKHKRRLCVLEAFIFWLLFVVQRVTQHFAHKIDCLFLVLDYISVEDILRLFFTNFNFFDFSEDKLCVENGDASAKITPL